MKKSFGQWRLSRKKWTKSMSCQFFALFDLMGKNIGLMALTRWFMFIASFYLFRGGPHPFFHWSATAKTMNLISEKAGQWKRKKYPNQKHCLSVQAEGCLSLLRKIFGRFSILMLWIQFLEKREKQFLFFSIQS